MSRKYVRTKPKEEYKQKTIGFTTTTKCYRLIEAFQKLQDEGITEATFEDICQMSGLHYYYVSRQLNYAQSALPKCYGVTIRKDRFGRVNQEERDKIEQKQKEIWHKEPRINKKLARDVLYKIATGKNIPDGYETYWLDGNIPKSATDSGCTITNVGLRKQEIKVGTKA